LSMVYNPIFPYNFKKKTVQKNVRGYISVGPIVSLDWWGLSGVDSVAKPPG